TELISAIPAAAPVPARDSEDIAQKGPSVPHIPTAAIASAASSAAGLGATPAPIKPIPPPSAASATCQRRSFVRSECWERTTIPIAAARYGKAERKPTARS